MLIALAIMTTVFVALVCNVMDLANRITILTARLDALERAERYANAEEWLEEALRRNRP